MTSKKFIAGFIELYRLNECLWKVTSVEYTNKNIKNHAYRKLIEFSKKFDSEADINFVKKKIQNLKTAFRKELKKVKDSQASSNCVEDVYVPKLWYYDLLLFTIDDGNASLYSRSDMTNIKYEIVDNADEILTDEDEDHQSKQIRLDEEAASESFDGFMPTITQKSMDFTSADRSTPKQFTRNISINQFRPKEDDCLPPCNDVVNQISKAPHDNDEFSAIAITWASKLRKLNEEQMVLADGLINEVLQKAYFNELTRTTAIKDNNDKPLR